MTRLTLILLVWLSVLLALFLLEVQAAVKRNVSITLKVMTFNLRFDNPEDGKQNWNFRKDRVANLIRSTAADLIGTQEALKNQLDDLLERLPDYNYVGVGRADGQTAGEYSAILYQKKRWQLLKSGNFWLSETPEVPGSRGWDASCERIVTWALLEEKESAYRLALYNTHFDHVGQTARKESALLLLERLKQIAGSLPVILTGDFNATIEAEPIRIILNAGFLRDSRKEAKQVHGPAWSFHGFGRVPEAERPLIDHIFISQPIQVEEYWNIFEASDGVYYSDHNPVLVVLKVKSE
ncbi:MAG: endonuclease/exonuclease/phosphatase family protein [Candidatus Aminicenantes bacterium]|nr:endonuclease/exonuclease/phosphatase family protein [Candidatus Aminicenantes bacterium]